MSVAERLGLAQSAIATLALGRRTLEMVLALDLAELSGVPVSALDPRRAIEKWRSRGRATSRGLTR